ncbi:hypothetical protein [Microbacterium terrisoli]|jgi:hypothetical protein|uniref:hypothetical protein n=1 Tax=Microbacterium terrisoli TaxID=3242192 RepID=UPI0028037526|nr:hypothetical protein [Microbacterium protaetiae]
MTPRRTRRTIAAAAVVACVTAGAGLVAAPAASAQLCIPLLLPCPSPSPTPTPTPTATPGGSATAPDPGTTPGPGTVPGAPGARTSPIAGAPGTDGGAPKQAAEPIDLALLPADDSMVFTQPSAQLSAAALSFSGLQGLALVKVRLADGSHVAALRLRADRITIDGFALTVRKDTGPILATTADRMTLSGHVEVYLNSLTATTRDGTSYTLGAHTPPPADGIEPGLLRVTLGMVGTRADQISYTNTNQRLTD